MIVSKQLLEQVVDIAKRAGHEIMEIYQRDFAVYDKADESPLTEADLAANKIITEGLLSVSDYPILSEESADIAWEERQQWTTYWLVDPLDGTKEFIKKNGEFTVNIALISEGFPILGVVYVPAQEKIYWGAQGHDAYLEFAEQNKKLSVREQFNPVVQVVGSRSHPSQDMQAYLKAYPEHEMVPMGSSLKFCVVAEGIADIYPRLGPTSEWDTGAAQAVLEQAGGQVFNYETGTRLKYNTKDSYLNPYFIATSETK